MRQKIDQFEEICKLIQNFEVDDVIIQTMKLKEILKIFTKNIVDEKLLGDLFDFLNTKALHDDDGFITKFVAVLCTRQMESFNINGKLLRHSMLEILQKNFQSADNYKRDDIKKFYNSIKLLGEYFNKSRTANGSPLNILGQSLLNLLNDELEKELKVLSHLKNDNFSELILTQMALNGNLLKHRHKTEIELVLMNIRKCLIEINSLTPKTKAFLLMSIDLHYNNFNSNINLEKSIEKIYEPYLLDKSNGNSDICNKKESKNLEPEVVVVQKTIKRDEPKKSRQNGSLQSPTSSAHPKPISSNDKKPERLPSVPKSPVKPLRPPLRKSEPHSPTIATKSPQKKISPKELRTRANSTTKTSPKNDKKVSSYSPKELYKVESAITKLQIQSKSSNDTNNTSTNVPQPTIDENIILKQQNSNGSSSIKSKTTANKVYFKEENVENLSWNGETETSFDDENPSDPTSPNQYSSSFLNFLSNN